MITFKNPGCIDMAAVTTMGVSVKTPGAFGYFGTGLKYSIATILRGGGAVHIYRGLQQHVFTMKKRQIRKEEFDIVCMDGKPLGFTTQLGRNWEPWMVLRELGCNAKDEGGDFWGGDYAVPETQHRKQQEPRHTTVIVWWDKLDDAMAQRQAIFAEGPSLLEIPERLRILPGPSEHIYYRGIRALKLQKPSVFTYDILETQTLTEDRTILGTWSVANTIRRVLVECCDREILEKALTGGPSCFESSLDFPEEWAQPSKAFMNVVLDARERKTKGLLDKARELVMKRLRTESSSTAGYTSYRGRADRFSEVIDALASLGLEIDLDTTPVVVVEELQGEAKSLAENGRIYVLRDLLREPKAAIAMELAYRILDLKGFIYADEMRDFLLPLLLQQDKDTSPHFRDPDVEPAQKREEAMEEMPF